jgi:hypothetical protein
LLDRSPADVTSQSVRETTSETERAILSYLSRRPGAQDTLLGISEWWLLEELIERSMPEVERAVSRLVAAGFVVRFEAEGTDPRYGINRERLAEVRGLLRSHVKD